MMARKLTRMAGIFREEILGQGWVMELVHQIAHRRIQAWESKAQVKRVLQKEFPRNFQMYSQSKRNLECKASNLPILKESHRLVLALHHRDHEAHLKQKLTISCESKTFRICTRVESLCKNLQRTTMIFVRNLMSQQSQKSI